MLHALKPKPSETGKLGTAKVRLPFVDPAADDSARRSPVLGSGQRLRRRIIRLSFLLVVAAPTLIVATYYAFIASDQYAAETRFAVRSATTTQTPDLMGIISGGGATGTVADAYVVIDFVRSRQILDLLAAEIDYKAIFARSNADWWARLDPALPMEDIILYWRRMVSVGFDTTSQIMTIQVRAFTPDESLKLTQAIIKQSEELINDLSARARADAVKVAEQEVERMEGRLRTARLALRTFREERQELDPRKKAEARQQIIETLQSELTTARAKLQAQRQQMSETAPSVVYQVNLIKALEKQIDEERNRIATVDTASASDGTIGGLIADFEALTIDREFAEKAYLSALASLERVRLDALRQQRYLATIVPPAMPEDALYPRRVLNTFMVLIGTFCLWGLSTLIGLAVRDHVS
jgi:capsular polysaccharide transport system permease protein